MSKFQGLVLQNLKLPKVFRKWIASFASQDHPSWAPPSHFSKTMVPLEPCKRAEHQLDSVDLQEDSKN